MKHILEELGIEPVNSGACGAEWLGRPGGPELVSIDPSTGETIARVLQASREDYERIADDASQAFERWRECPAPRRGEIVREIGVALRAKREALGELVTLEMGKIRAEGIGEVQEMIDIADFGVGLSRQLYGLTMHSERPGHRMYEQWHPLGVVGIITAFNFPVAVWAWNAAIAAVAGDTMIWKPSSETPLTAIAVQKLVKPILDAHGFSGIMTLAIGRGREIGEAMLHDGRISLVSATGSTEMGRHVAEVVSARFGRTILELGGNNAITVLDDADLDLATRAILFAAVGTAGQRCTTVRRIVVERGIAPRLLERLAGAYRQVRIGDPLDPGTIMGPLVSQAAVDDMMTALRRAEKEGGEIVCGGRRLDRAGFFVEPTIVRARPEMAIVKEETFAPILYFLECSGVEEAIRIQNGVPQGLSSAIFTRDLLAAERFLSAAGSDCGIANVNIGTSGAEIGGAFGGEKETGGGREAGSDSWKQYMRRQTCTINWSRDLPLAQGIHFG